MIARLFALLQRLAEPALCSVRVRGDELAVTKGTLPPGLRRDLADAAHELGLRQGRIDVVQRAGRLQLRFDPQVPAHCHQRLRNVFGVFLASAPLGSRRPRRR